VYLRFRGKKAPELTPHPKASPAPSNKASNAEVNFIVEYIRNYSVLQERQNLALPSFAQINIVLFL